MKGYIMANDVEVYAGTATIDAVDKLASGKASVFSTISGDDAASRMAVFEATTASVPLAENLNKVIELANIVVQVIDLTDEETGEVQTVPRTVLIAKDGTAYHAISQGVFKSVENLLGILGMPETWAGPVRLKAVKGGTGTRQYMTLVPAK